MKQYTYRRFIHLTMVLAGVVLILSSFILPDDRQPSNSLAALGLMFAVIGLVRLIHMRRILGNPERRRQYEISQQDERNKFIMHRAAAQTLWISVYAELAAEIGMLYCFDDPAMNHIGVVLAMVICAQILIYIALSVVIDKRY
ncbi:MAG: hypothetical protein ACI4PM_03840 [Butyricicoccus sp.]